MVDYTLPILLTITTVLNYLLVYEKNRLFGNLIFFGIGISSMIIDRIVIGTVQHEVIIFSTFMMIISLISFIYDFFIPKNQGA